MSLITTAPAPTVTLQPIFTPCFITELAPIKLPSPIQTLPDNTAPGAMWEKSPILHSCSIIDPVLIIHPFPIFTCEFIIAPAQTSV